VREQTFGRDSANAYVANCLFSVAGGESGIMTVDIAIDWKVYRTCDQVCISNFITLHESLFFANILNELY
jgi:hypothetical protein